MAPSALASAMERLESRSLRLPTSGRCIRFARAAGLPLCCCLASVVLPCRNGQLFSQDLPSQRESSLHSNSLFRPSDALLGALFIGSFLLIDPLESLDLEASRRLSGGEVSGGDGPHFIGARAMGTLPFGLALTGATYLIGGAAGNSSLQRAGLHSLWTFLAVDAATRLFKHGVGRARPYAGDESDIFEPFRSGSDYKSFPSGHTSHMFALAHTFSRELKDEAPWVPFVAYPLATWTAVSRVADRKHWVTDVVAGAALGILVSNVVDRALHGRDDDDGLSWTLAPGPDGGIGVAISAPAP